MPSPSPYHHGNLKVALIEVALCVLEKQGLEALSLRALAKDLGVSNNAPYRHFKNKQALLAAMATEGFLRLADACETQGENWQHRLRDSGIAYIHFAKQNPALFRLMFSHKFQSEAYQQASQAALDQLKAIIDQSGADDLEAHLLTSWGLVHGLAHIIIDGLYAHPIEDKTLAQAILQPSFVESVVRGAK